MSFSILSVSAANLIYRALVYLLAVLSVLGGVEFIIHNPTLIPIVSPKIALASLLLAIIAISARRLKVKKYSIKVTLPIFIIFFTAFLLLQHMLWRGFSGYPINPRINPFDIITTSLIVFALMSMLLIKLSYNHVPLKKLKKTRFVVFLCILTGTAFWHANSIELVHEQENNSKAKVNLMESMINQKLSEKTNAFGRIQLRQEKVTDSNFIPLLKEDINNYTDDYPIIKGMILLDGEFNEITSDDFSHDFYNTGLLTTPGIIDWYKEDNKEVRFAALLRTLSTPDPMLVFTIPVNAPSNELYYLLAILDINLLLEEKYLEYLNLYRAYIEVTPDLFISLGAYKSSVDNLQTLQDEFGYITTVPLTIGDSFELKTHIFLSHYSSLYRSVSIDQVMLWISFLFVYVFILAADSSYLLRKRALYDELTGVLRMDALEEGIIKRFGKSDINDFSFILIELDYFNETYNALGHKLSEALVKQVADRLNNVTSGDHLVSRVSSFGFIVCLVGISKSDLYKKIHSMLESLSKKYYIGDLELFHTASAGVDFMSSVESLDIKLNLQRANIAIAHAKEHGGNQLQFYRKSMDDRHNQLIQVRNDLQLAMEKQELQVFYQPIHCLTTHKVLAVESLVRWSKNGQWISPVVFIPIAESTGQIIQVGEQVLKRVMSDINQTEQLQDITVAVNFSAKQIQQDHFAANLIKLLSDNNINHQRFTVEVTESTFLDKSKIESVSKQLIHSKVNVAIDDFGAGYSSLSSLASQPANIVKVDRAFTKGAEIEGKERNFLESIIQICVDLDKTVVVEGLENKSLLDYLSKYKSHKISIQGYYFSKPLPLNELVEYINNQKNSV